MPRRWTNSRKTRKPEQETAAPELSYEGMARAIVDAGKASPAILHTMRNNRFQQHSDRYREERD